MLRNIMKKVFLHGCTPFLRVIGCLFFDAKYLKGRFFDNTCMGWLWVLRSIFFQKILGFNRGVPWPVSPFIRITNFRGIFFDVNDLNNFQTFGCYFQCIEGGKIFIGKGTYIGPNVGLITASHNPYNLDEHLPAKDIVLGEGCWIGMNSVILPGVELGPRTIVAAGSVVNKSFPEGNCVIGGNPAKIIKFL